MKMMFLFFKFLDQSSNAERDLDNRPQTHSLLVYTGWRQQMEIFSSLVAFCVGNYDVTVMDAAPVWSL